MPVTIASAAAASSSAAGSAQASEVASTFAASAATSAASTRSFSTVEIVALAQPDHQQPLGAARIEPGQGLERALRVARAGRAGDLLGQRVALVETDGDERRVGALR